MPHRIEMHGVIGWSFWSEDIVARLREIEKSDDTDVLIHLNSAGGEVFEAVAIHNRLRQHSGKITLVVDALAASAATLIMMAADKILVPRNATIMVHRSWVFTAGNAEDMRHAAGVLDVTDESMIGMYAERTGLEREEVIEMMQAETWMGGEEAVRLGFGDELFVIGEKEEQEVEASRVAALTQYTRIAAKADSLRPYASAPDWAQAPTQLTPPPVPVAQDDPEEEAEEMAEELEEMQEELADARERIAQLEEENEELREAAAQDEEDEDADAEAQAAAQAAVDAADAAAASEQEALVARVRELEDEAIRKDLVAARIPEEHHEGLLALKRQDEGLYASAVQNLTPKPVQPPIGRTGDGPAVGADTAEQILAEAKSKGYSYGNKLTVFLAAEYPDRVAEVAAVAKEQFLAEAQAAAQPN